MRESASSAQIIGLFDQIFSALKLTLPPGEGGDAVAPWDSEQLCICRLYANTYLAVAPPAFLVWITITLTFS